MTPEVFKRPADFRISLEGGSPWHEDLALLERLSREHGADLTRRRTVRLFMRFPSEALAFETGRLLHAAGFRVSGLPPYGDGDDAWGLRAIGEAQVDHANVADFRARFDGLARSHDGELERWEAAARP